MKAEKQPGTLSGRSRQLLDDLDLRRRELDRVMAEHPTLTRVGLAWSCPGPGSWEYRHGLPRTTQEHAAYGQQREELRRQLTTGQEYILELGANAPGCREIEHHGEIPLALMYLEYCQRSSEHQAYSYGLKHRAENIGPPPYYISNGAMIAAAGMAGCRIQQQETHGRPEMNAYLYLTEPSRCGDKGTKRENGCQQNLIPAGSRNRLCDDCRQASAS